MVAIFTGGGLGLQRGSASVLGATGLLGEASLGRGGDQVFVNAATGNLVVNRGDEFLVGRGPDAFYSQTYNSVSEPAYVWDQGVHRTLSGITGTINAAGRGVWRFFAYDGAGNQTLILESEGMDLAAHSLDQAIAAATAGGSVGGGFVDQINATIAIFGRRGQQTGTRLPFRELKAADIPDPGQRAHLQCLWRGDERDRQPRQRHRFRL